MSKGNITDKLIHPRGATIARIAQRNIQTPGRHKGRDNTLDHIGLVMRVYKDMTGRALPAPIFDYSQERDVRHDHEWLTRWLSFFCDVKHGEADIGDIITYRMHPKNTANHCGILSSPNTLVHQYTGAVEEILETPYWKTRRAQVFSIRPFKFAKVA